MGKFINFSSFKYVTLLVSGGAVSSYIFYYFIKKIRSKYNSKSQIKIKKWIKIGQVSKLLIYPIKSCKEIIVDEAEATEIGLKSSEILRDRIFMIIDSKYVFQTQRTHPKMVLINVKVENDNIITLSGLNEGSITFSVPELKISNKKTCRVKEDIVDEVYDCGEEVGKWIDNFLQVSNFRLVYHAGEKCQRKLTAMQKSFPNFLQSDKGSLQDHTSFMLISNESLNYLNTKLSQKVTFRHFRPNIIIEGLHEPFGEDKLTFIKIGENGPVLKTSKPCTRCKMTTVNPDNGEFDPNEEPVKTLEKLDREFGNDVVNNLVKNKGVLGAQFRLVEKGENVKLGDPVYAALL